MKADVVYGIQVMATGRRMDPRDPFFHGYEPMELQVGKLYKYIICTDPSLEKVKAQVKKVKSVFKDIYLVKVEDGTTSAAR